MPALYLYFKVQGLFSSSFWLGLRFHFVLCLKVVSPRVTLSLFFVAYAAEAKVNEASCFWPLEGVQQARSKLVLALQVAQFSNMCLYLDDFLSYLLMIPPDL